MSKTKAFNVAYVSSLLECSPTTIIRRIKDGSLKAEKINNHWYITENALTEFVNTNKSASTCRYKLESREIDDLNNLTVYRPNEIADKLRVSEQAVRKWIKKGKLKAIKPGGRVLIPDEYFKDFVNTEFTPLSTKYIDVDDGTESNG